MSSKNAGKQLNPADILRRVVIKLGTRTVVGDENEFCLARLRPVARSIATFMSERRQIVLVSSGAVGLGAAHLGLSRARLRDVVTRQACAAVGQSLLMHSYEQLFRAHGVSIAQVLLTERDFGDRQRYADLRLALERLLKLGVLPILNENDAVSTREIEYLDQSHRVFSDNDLLAALVTSKLEADALVILTHVDGLLRKGINGEEPISKIEAITPELRRLARGPDQNGRGGMVTKLKAAEIAMRTGALAIIANGCKPDTLSRIFSGEQVGTMFVPSARLNGRRRWLTYVAGIQARLVVDDGARDAVLSRKASLLISGVTRIEGTFCPNDVVTIADRAGRVFARGMINCDSNEAGAFLENRQKQQGASSGKTLVLITRNNIVLLD